jgi:SNF2 family DNA or RNA helicase
MALTQILRQQCKVCDKIAVEISRIKIGKTLLIKLACGHTLSSQVLATGAASVYENIIFTDGGKPRPYQIEAIKFGEAADCNFILADEQGLGKTIEVGSLLKLHPEQLLPAVIVCPSAVKLQWLYELKHICGTDKQFLPQVISSGIEKAIPGFQIYIITYDILKNKDVLDFLPEGYIKTVIIDECQKIKNHLSERAKAVQRVARSAKHVIPMSGSPIYNHAGEYFTVLNLVAPMKFPHYQRYIDNYCDSYNNGWAQKIGGLKNKDLFHAETKDIIIRRTKAEVLPDLPEKERKFHHVELDRKLNKVYDALIKELEDSMYDEDAFGATGSAIAIMSRMRHITGISKVAECVDFVTEFLLSTDRKIVVFVHHHDVMGMLQTQLDQWCAEGDFGKVCVLHSGLSGNERTALVEIFKSSADRRVMLCMFTEGLNLQFCSDAIVLERQWTPKKEEQSEDRFHRFGQVNKVSITYFIASGTIDDFLTELVEIKRARIAATVDNEDIEWNQQSLMKELAEALITHGRKAWSL